MDLQGIRRTPRLSARIWLLAVLLCWVLLGTARADAQVSASPPDDPTTAWLKNCDAGVAADCRALGKAYLTGEGKSTNPPIAAVLFEQACNGDDLEACFLFAEQLAYGSGSEADVSRAVAYYRKACDGGFPDGCVGFANRYFLGEGVPADKTQGEALLTDACNRKQVKACDELARRYVGGIDVDQQVMRGLALYEKNCGAGAGASCAALAIIYREGQPVARDPGKAAAYFAKACQTGDAESCVDEAEIYLKVPQMGELIMRDMLRATALIARGCDLGSAHGCDTLGRILFEGTAIAQDKQRAAGLFDRACSLDTSRCENYRLIREEATLREGCSSRARDACATLAKLYASPLSVGFDDQRANTAFEAACDLGDADSCQERLDRIYVGANGTQDSLEARIFLQKMCDLGKAKGCEDFGRLLYGDGVGQDKAKAGALLDKACALEDFRCANFRLVKEGPQLWAACNGGAADQCVTLAGLYDEPDSVGNDPAGTEMAFEKACEAGRPPFCVKRGDMARKGTVSPPDLARAAFWYGKACFGNSRSGCANLAYHYEKGFGVPINASEAARLYQRACLLGSEESCEKLPDHVELNLDQPIPVADTDYRPPVKHEKPVFTCTFHTQEFRGKTYTYRKCKGVAALHSYPVPPGRAPWQALLQRPPNFGLRVACGGSLIAEGWVLTAAHCVFDQGQDLAKAGYRIILGAHNIATGREGISYPIRKVVPYKDATNIRNSFQNDGRYVNDIALIQIDVRRGQNLGRVGPIRSISLDTQPVGQRPITDGMLVYSYGWGYTQAAKQSFSVSDEMRGVEMALWDEQKCAGVTGFTGDRANIALCAKGGNGAQTCYGDSGGGLIYYDDRDRIPKVIGVVSAGVECGTSVKPGKVGRPSQYTRVAKKIDWIKSIINAPGR